MVSRYFSGFSFNELYYQIQQDWFVFILLFFISFALIYMALSRVFTKKSKPRYRDVGGGALEALGSKKYIENQPIVLLISICVSLLVTIGFFQSPFYKEAYSFLFSGLNVLFPLVLLAGFIALIFKKLSGSVGSLFAIELVILFVWGFAKYLSSSDFMYSIPFDFQQIIYFLSNIVTLIVALVAGFFLSKIKKN